MAPRRIKARLGIVSSGWIAMHDVDDDKVAALVEHLRGGGTVPPVVVVRYGNRDMVLDGHHRLRAASHLATGLTAWIVDGPKFERLDLACRNAGLGDRAEDYVMCGDVPALMVAPRARPAGRAALAPTSQPSGEQQ